MEVLNCEMGVLVKRQFLENIFHVKTRLGTGTCFRILHREHTLLFTAAHCVTDTREGENIQIKTNEGWTEFTVQNIAFSPTGLDCAVLEVQIQSQFRLDQTNTDHRLDYGKDYAYCGFPLGFEMHGSENGHPYPLIKVGAYSGHIVFNNQVTNLLDSYGNKGFSGGPVIGNFAGAIGANTGVKIVGVISGGIPDSEEQIHQRDPEGKFKLREELITYPQSGYARFISITDLFELADELIANTHTREPIPHNTEK